MNEKLLGGGIVFFCRAYNDIDHMTPIIYKLKQTQPKLTIELIINDIKKTYDDDFRIIFLRSIGINIVHILDLISSKKKWLHFYLNEQEKRRVRYYSRIKRFLINRTFLIPMENHFDKALDSFSGDDFINIFFVNPPKAMVFDQSSDKLYLKLCSSGKQMNIKTVAVPHGHNILDNELIWSKSMDIHPGKTNIQSKSPYDYVVFENYIIMKRYISLGIIDNAQSVVLGSSRFSDEWMKKIREIIPSNSPKKLPSGVLKIVIMLSKSTYNGFTEELIRSINFTAKFPDVYLIVKPHTRRKRFTHLDHTDNVFVDNNHDYDSPSLIDWADVVMFEHSCICFDSIKNDKPTIYLKSTHANRLMSEHIFDSWEVHCRDDLRTFLWKLIENKNYRTYSKEDAKKFCEEVIEPAGKDVLSNYVNFLLDLLARQL
jgi:hypothetical protein